MLRIGQEIAIGEHDLRNPRQALSDAPDDDGEVRMEERLAIEMMGKASRKIDARQVGKQRLQDLRRHPPRFARNEATRLRTVATGAVAVRVELALHHAKIGS
jgi:hypothetical protein